jgi:hypothetical protein
MDHLDIPSTKALIRDVMHWEFNQPAAGTLVKAAMITRVRELRPFVAAALPVGGLPHPVSEEARDRLREGLEAARILHRHRLIPLDIVVTLVQMTNDAQS